MQKRKQDLALPRWAQGWPVFYITQNNPDVRGLTVQTATETSLPAQSKTVPCDIVLMNTFLVPGEEEQSSPGERQKDLEVLLSFATNGRMLPVLVSATALPAPRQERYQ